MSKQSTPTFTLNLTIYQVKKLTEYFLDISKGILLTSLSLPFINSNQGIFLELKVIAQAIFFLFLSLELSQSIR